MAAIPNKFPAVLLIIIGLFLGLAAAILLFLTLQLTGARQQPLPVLGEIAPFTLTNQDGRVTTLADLTNHVWVADIIFTRCAGPCPVMTGQMKSVQDALPANSNAKLVTLTTDPYFDTPPVLKRYGGHYGADFNRWMFLTGAKGEIAALAAGSLKLSAIPVQPADQKNAADLFIHATLFVVVDQQARLRGIFETEGEGVEWSQVRPRLIETVSRLEREP
jgi:cytochrome oxidase Cu insertion factor (SCO1/SenC/PrrC family)